MKAKYPIINFFNKICIENAIGLPCTPGKWLSDAKIKDKVTCITITCGGGMGGSKWDEYAMGDISSEIVPNAIISIKTANGHVKQINTNYIVCSTVYNMVEADLYTTNTYSKFSGTHTVRWLTYLENKNKIKLYNEYNSKFWSD